MTISEFISILKQTELIYGDKEIAIVADETTLNDVPNIKFDNFYEIIELDFGIEGE